MMPALRVGVVRPAVGLRQWQVRCLERLVAEGAASLVLVATAHQDLVPPSALRRLVGVATSNIDPLGLADDRRLFDGVEQVDVLHEATVAELDVIVDFGDATLADDVAAAARFGIWRYLPGGGVGPSVAVCFWAAMAGAGTFAVSLIADTGRQSRVLQRGVFRTEAAWVDNVEMAFGSCGEWITSAANRLRLAPGGLNDLPVAHDAGETKVPGWVDLGMYRCRSLGRSIRRQFARALSHDVWHVGFVRQSWADLMATGKIGDVAWMAPAPPGRYYADPFVLEDGDERTLLVEDFSYGTGRARISEVGLDDVSDRSAMAPAIDGPHHLSYPFVVQDGDITYCVPEQGESGRLLRYARDETGKWRSVGPIGPGPVIDGTLMRRDGKWWLFGGLPGEAQYNLRIWFAEELGGPWHAHPLNPVTVDVRSARSAGPLVSHEGRLFRPAQNSARGYGGSLCITEIVELSTSAFREEVRAKISPDSRWPFPHGLHTISGYSGGYVIDAKRTKLSPRSGFYRLLTRWRTVRRLAGTLPVPADGEAVAFAGEERGGR